MKYPIAGTTIADLTGLLTIYDQLEGTGIVQNKVLAVSGHLNGLGNKARWASVEYVRVDPVHDGMISSVGLHTQETDEIYIGLEGRGDLITNGVSSRFSAGTLAIAPHGTRHTISNPSHLDALEFLVVEVQAPERTRREPTLIDLPALMQTNGNFHSVTRHGKPIQPEVAHVNLASYMDGPWGVVSLVEVPADAEVGEYIETGSDQLLFLKRGEAHITLTASRKTEAEPYDGNRVIQRTLREMGDRSVAIPAGVPCRLVNCSSRLNKPLTLLSISVLRGTDTASLARADDMAEARA